MLAERKRMRPNWIRIRLSKRRSNEFAGRRTHRRRLPCRALRDMARKPPRWPMNRNLRLSRPHRLNPNRRRCLRCRPCHPETPNLQTSRRPIRNRLLVSRRPRPTRCWREGQLHNPFPPRKRNRFRSSRQHVRQRQQNRNRSPLSQPPPNPESKPGIRSGRKQSHLSRTRFPSPKPE